MLDDQIDEASFAINDALDNLYEVSLSAQILALRAIALELESDLSEGEKQLGERHDS